MTDFFQQQGFAIIAAIIIFAVGVLLRPALEALGRRLLSWIQGVGSGFQKRYYKHLLDEYRVMNLRGRKTRYPVALEVEQVYVSLKTQLPDIEAARRQRTETMSIGQAMERSSRLVIIGEPGSGKTTLLVYLLLTFARRRVQERLGFREKRLPIFIPLRRLKEVLARSDRRNLPDYLTDHYTELGLPPPARFFERKLKAGRCLVLLDGLDEVVDQAERVRLAEWIDTQVTFFGDNRFIVSSRPAGYDAAALGNAFFHLEIQDFDPEDVELFCHNWCLAVELATGGRDTPEARRKAAAAAKNLLRAIGGSRAVQELAVNPLLLSIIALVHRNRPLPRRRVELYAECTDVLLGIWDEAKELLGRLTESQKRAVLQPVALHMHLNESQELARSALLDQLKQHLPKVTDRPEEAELFLQEIRDRSGLLLEQELNRYTFSHLTFQEYLVARELADNGPERTLLDHAGEEWWQEVILLYTGLKDGSSVVKTLFERASDRNPAPLLLAGRCLLEAQRIEKPIRASALKQLKALFNTGSGRPFLEAGHILAELEGEQVLTRFLRVVGGEDEARRNAALWALEQMLTSKKEEERHRYQDQLVKAIDSLETGPPAVELLEEMEWQKDPQWTALVTEWMQHKSYDLDWLSNIVIHRQTSVSQFIVSLLNYESVVNIAADWMDGMMAPIPGKGAYMARYPVTNAQYRRFLANDGYGNRTWWSEAGWEWRQENEKIYSHYWNDEQWNGPSRPVVDVAWYEAEAYCSWLSNYTGRTYRLPYEAEWQQAAQGEDDRTYPWGNEWQVGLCNTAEADIRRTSPVGRFSPDGDSPIGCADMSGNVWEWCLDWYDEQKDVRVLRGGSWVNLQDDAHCAVRSRWCHPSGSDHYFGFRVVSPIVES